MIFILIVVFHKLRLIKDMGGIMLKEALFLCVCLFFCFLSFFGFLDCVKYNYYQQQQFLQQKYKNNLEVKKNNNKNKLVYRVVYYIE